jgi:hypothetical protein
MPSPALLLLMSIAATPAAAASIEAMSTVPAAQSTSIVTLGCLSCKAAEKPRLAVTTPSALAPGQQILTLQERHGKPVLLRTEAWMGGSPVTFVSLNPVWIDREEQAIVLRAMPSGRTDPATPADALDTGTTAAVPPQPATRTAPSSPPDFSGVALRPSL